MQNKFEKLLADKLARSDDWQQQALGKARAIRQTLFDKQLAFDKDQSKRKAAFCTRRAGKTDYVPKHLMMRALLEPESVRLYLAVTRVRAKELIWRNLEIINEKYKIGAKPNETLATWTLPNHAVIRLRGADDIKEAEKGRGDKLHEVIIDEAQIFGAGILENMIDNVYGPTLEDVQGSIHVMGTPGVICAGKWWEMTRPDQVQREPGWSVHEWGVLDNPFMAHMKWRLPELKKEHNWADDNPTYLREWLGRWVNDNTALYYKFDPTRNCHDMKESDLIGGDWLHVVGWDIGLRDNMALTVWAFHPRQREVYEAFSWAKNGITSERVVEEVRKLEQRGFNFVGMVADTGGLGALVVEEVGKRYGMHFEAAQKTQKGAHVELFNDELLTGRAKLMRGSVYAREIAVLPKDLQAVPVDIDDPKKINSAKRAQLLKWPVEDARFPNHNCDAGLYAWRKSLHWTFEPEKPKLPRPGTIEWHAHQNRRQMEIVKEIEEKMLKEIEEKKDKTNFWDDPFELEN